jgi:hypothetical protein
MLFFIRFRVHYKTNYGAEVRLVGSHDKLGQWDPHKAREMRWRKTNIWQTDIPVQGFEPFEYKYILIDTHTNKVTWESCSNHIFIPKEMDSKWGILVDVFDYWDDPERQEAQWLPLKYRFETRAHFYFPIVRSFLPIASPFFFFSFLFFFSFVLKHFEGRCGFGKGAHK